MGRKTEVITLISAPAEAYDEIGNRLDTATQGAEFARARIGTDAASYVDVTVDTPGPAGNDYSIEVVLGSEADQPMSTAVDGTEVTVTLGTDAGGDPNPTKNTADLVAAAIDALAGVSAFTPGVGTGALSVAQGPVQFAGGANEFATPLQRTIFAEEVAVYGTTYYNAARTGIRPSKMFDIWRREYSDEEKLIHGGVSYRVIRTEARGGEELRLTCERVAADS